MTSSTVPGPHPEQLRGRLAGLRDRDWRMLIGGRLTRGHGGRCEVVDPATEEVLAEVPDTDRQDVAEAVAAAEAAFEGWRRTTPRSRAKLLRGLVGVLEEHRDEFGFLDAVDSGNPIRGARGDVSWAVDAVEVLADSALELCGQTIPATAEHLHYTSREPYGVVARLVPFNHPLFFSAAKIAAPLLAGNTVVLKAPDQTPLSPLRLGELLADCLPPGVVNVVAGTGAVAGDALVRHPRVRRVAFIGSVPTGRGIQRAAAETGVKTVSLELGGKNPMLVFPDADPAAAAASALAGMNFNTQGQSCGSTSRLLVHESLAADVVGAVVAGVETIRVGSPLDEATDMGPLVSRRHHDHVTQLVRTGVEQGATVATGGATPDGSTFERGYWLAPTVFTGVTPGMRIATEEIFGPVLSVLTWRDEEEAVALANAVDYGLTASIWTDDLRTAHRVARRIDAGYLWINGVSRHFWGTPFGGFKDSGVGREEGAEELLSFTQTKTINVLLG
jgi:2-formylbenzoate dehydrogenase